jgi:hypothetical protein
MYVQMKIKSLFVGLILVGCAFSKLDDAAAASPVCEVLKTYPRLASEKLAFHSGEISPLCTPFIRQKSRGELDRCGDNKRDPYSSNATSASQSTKSNFTWSSRSEMARKGKVNLFTDPGQSALLPKIYERIEELRGQAKALCCADDKSCGKMIDNVEVKFCKPNQDPNAPDPCVFGGNFKMSGSDYQSAFQAIRSRSNPSTEINQIATRNLNFASRLPAQESARPLSSGSIVLSSYVSRDEGFAAMEPTLLHEFGHACSMTKMQLSAVNTSPEKKAQAVALRAAQYLDRARLRCNADVELPTAYFDFWESIGETRGLAQCLMTITTENQRAAVDRPCNGLCPGHFLEESVGIVFSLLLGDLSGVRGAVFPQTCDHVRDGQHPMVSDVLECLTQHSPRFRERMSQAHHCSSTARR